MDGGTQERQLMEQYRAQAQALQAPWSCTAAMLRRLAQWYEKRKHTGMIAVILQHIVAKLSAIYFTRRAARYASQREFKSKWEISHHLSWLVKSVHAKASPPFPFSETN